MKKRRITGHLDDTVKDVKAVVDFVSERNGGNGAVREFIEWIIDEKQLRLLPE